MAERKEPFSWKRHESFLRCRDAILAALVAEMDKRKGCADLSWVDNERYATAKAANQWAAAHGEQPVTVDDVEQVEHLAVGHVDYASKLALYVAETVYGQRAVAASASSEGDRG